MNIESAVSTSTTMMFLWFLFTIAIFAFNQCNSNITGCMTFTALRYPPLLACLVTHSSFVGFSTCPLVGLTTHLSLPGQMTHTLLSGLTTHSSLPGLTTHSSLAGLTTHSSLASLMTQPLLPSLTTHSLYFGLVGVRTWPSFIGLATQLVTQSAVYAIQFPFIQNHAYTHLFACKLCHHIKWLAWPFMQYDVLSFMDCSHSVDQLIARIMMKLRRYITRRHDFACYWIGVLSSALLQTRCNAFWSLLIMSLCLCAIAVHLFPFLHMPYLLITRNKKRVMWCLTLILVLLYSFIRLIAPFQSSDSTPLTQDKKIKCKFVGGGASAHTDYESLKLYLISTDDLIQNPEQYNYVYNGHCVFNKALQIVQTTGDKHVICNIPIGHVAGILTTSQANDIAKEHNIPALSRKSLAEKRKSIKSHICTKNCSSCVIIFKVVSKNKKDLKGQSVKKEKIKKKSQPKKYWVKPKRDERNHKLLKLDYVICHMVSRLTNLVMSWSQG